MKEKRANVLVNDVLVIYQDGRNPLPMDYVYRLLFTSAKVYFYMLYHSIPWLGGR